jgi:hypothetical protein
MPSIATPKDHDPRQHFHGYAIVRGGTLYPFEGETYDVIGVEVLKPDGSIAGPYVGGHGLPRRRNAVKVAAGDVAALVPKYPTQSTVFRILRERSTMKTRAEPTPTKPRRVVPRVAPRLSAVMLWSTVLRDATNWRLDLIPLRRRAPMLGFLAALRSLGIVTGHKSAAVGKSTTPMVIIPHDRARRRAHA